MVKVVIVDDHDLVREGVRDFLDSLPGFSLVGDARTARAAFELIDAVRPDIVVIDIAMPGMDGIVATREILRRMRRARVVVLSAHGQKHDVVDAFNAGAIGYVLKGDPPETLAQALDCASRGCCYVAPALAGYLPLPASHLPTDDALGVLSEREHEIFRLAADCRTAQEIARELCLARKTVDTHLNRIHRKLGLHDRASLVRLAASLGLVHSIRSSLPTPSTVNGASNETSVSGLTSLNLVARATN